MSSRPFQVGDVVRVHAERLSRMNEGARAMIKDKVYIIEMIKGSECHMVTNTGEVDIMWYTSSLELCDLCYCDNSKIFSDSCFDCMEKMFP